MTNPTLGTQIASRYAELGKNVCGYDARVWNFRFFDAGCATKRSCPGSRRTRQNRHNLGENRFRRSRAEQKGQFQKRISPAARRPEGIGYKGCVVAGLVFAKFAYAKHLRSNAD